MKFKSEKSDKIEEVSNEIKDVVGYLYNDIIYKTKLDAKIARANNKLEKLFPTPTRDYMSMIVYIPDNNKFLSEYKNVLNILKEIDE